MSRLPIFLAALVPATLFSATPALAEQSEGRVNALIVYGDDPCPQSSADEITVCARKSEGERYVLTILKTEIDWKNYDFGRLDAAESMVVFGPDAGSLRALSPSDGKETVLGPSAADVRAIVVSRGWAFWADASGILGRDLSGFNELVHVAPTVLSAYFRGHLAVSAGEVYALDEESRLMWVRRPGVR